MNLLMLIFITATPVYTKIDLTGETESPIDILKSVTIKRVDLKTTHEEADHILAHLMVATPQENQKGVSVVSDDTDVFVLLLHCYQAQNLSILVVISHQRESCHRHTTDSAGNSNIVPGLICYTCSIRM